MLKDRTAIVTGSTGGLGLGRARAFAQAVCNVVLDGLGDPNGIEATRAGLAKEHGVEVTLDGANMLGPEEIARFFSRIPRITQGNRFTRLP